ncbi:MAG: hypothetical protein ACLQM6_09745 [Acidobacteriaceae bacterium]
MIVGFHDRMGERLHDQFQKWRRANPEGYFLTFKTQTRGLIHLAGCHHPGPIQWDGKEHQKGKIFWSSLTTARKVCSNSQEELLSWAERNGIAYRACAHCIQGPLAKRRTIRTRYSEYKAERKVERESSSFNAAPEVEPVLEGILKEITTKARSRSASLRRTAIAKSKGVCAACRTDFSGLLDGRGLRVLQVHHRKQLALAETPVWNSVADLAVLCANCHLLVHSNAEETMEVEFLRKLLARK